MDPKMDKKALRSHADGLRTTAHALNGETAPLTLARRGLPVAVPPGTVVTGFMPFRSEISLKPLLAQLASAGAVTALPVVMGRGLPLTFRAHPPGGPLVPGLWDIPVPPPEAEEVEPDILLVPLLAFDRRGYRLGYGGGFYDRTLSSLRQRRTIAAIGVAYAAQEVDAVPRRPYDQPLDWIMTEQETFKCG
jgi:5-formyltetrahydrofolate cyclo-ligase